jgi:predicted dithiol-disulfide oxidoreductase (DUF899 family)
VSSLDNEFNNDHRATVDTERGVSTYNFARVEGDVTGEVPGTSVFLRPDPHGDDVFHTYSSYARGGDQLLTMYTYLDLTPLGRQEDAGSSRRGVATGRSCPGYAATTSTELGEC